MIKLTEIRNTYKVPRNMKLRDYLNMFVERNLLKFKIVKQKCGREAIFYDETDLNAILPKIFKSEFRQTVSNNYIPAHEITRIFNINQKVVVETMEKYRIEGLIRGVKVREYKGAKYQYCYEDIEKHFEFRKSSSEDASAILKEYYEIKKADKLPKFKFENKIDLKPEVMNYLQLKVA